MNTRFVVKVIAATLSCFSLSLSQEFPWQEPGELAGPFDPIVVYNSPVRPDIRIHGNTFNQIDLSIASSTTDPGRILIGSYNSGYAVDYIYSTNGGLSWTGNAMLQAQPGAHRPVVAFDASGNAFFLYKEPASFYYLWIHKSLDGGTTWQSRIGVDGYSNFPFTPHMAIDATPSSNYSNYIYVGYTEWVSAPAPIMVSRSINGGSSFLPPMNISAPVTSYYSQGVRLTVGANGHVYAAWAIGDDLNPPQEAIGFNHSTNGGQFWETAQRAIEISGIGGEWTHKNPTHHPIAVFDYPSIAVDRSGGPNNGRVYVVWPDRRNGDPDIYFAAWTPGSGTNLGGTWSFPKRVNDDALGNGKDQWMPWITVTDQGVIMIVFYDSRNDPNNQLTEAWVAQSIDGGNTFKNYRSSDVAFTPYPVFSGDSYLGSYIGIASMQGYTLPCWTDNRPTQSPHPYQAYVERFGTLKISYPAAAGWNMTGVPSLVYDFHKSAVYPALNPNSIYIYSSSGYQVAPDPLDNYRGYWVQFPSAQTVVYMGAPVTSSDYEVQNGWNIIGSISEPVQTSNVIQIPSGIVQSSYFKYDGGYVAVTTLEPGRGHWVKTSPGGLLRLVAPGGPQGAPAENPLAALDRFSVSDGEGSTQDMYVRNGSSRMDPEEGGDEEMPPDPPGGGMNISIGPGYFIKSVPTTLGTVEPIPIVIKHAEYPVTLSWDIIPANGLRYWMVRTKSGKNEERIRIEGKGSLPIENLSDGIIHLEAGMAIENAAKGSNGLQQPMIYLLHQNNPNPFNPMSVIGYQIPEERYVSLIVYDLLGREVATLVDGVKQAGYYEADFDASSLSSGLYFYRMQAGDFVAVRKLVLLK